MGSKSPANFSSTNLNSIYNGWGSLPTLVSNIVINFGTIQYTSASTAGKAILSGTYGWTITDGGLEP